MDDRYLVNYDLKCYQQIYADRSIDSVFYTNSDVYCIKLNSNLVNVQTEVIKEHFFLILGCCFSRQDS